MCRESLEEKPKASSKTTPSGHRSNTETISEQRLAAQRDAAATGAAASQDFRLKAGFRLRQWQVLPSEGLLRSGSEARHLAPQLMDILIYFARHPGRVVSKGEILEAVWSDTAVEEGALARCVSELRRALGDSAREPKFIRTVVKRGYLLVSPVAPPDDGLTAAAQRTEPESAQQVATEQVATEPEPTEPETTVALPAPVRRRPIGLRPVVVLGLGLILAVTGLGVWAARDRTAAAPESQRLEPQLSIAVLGIANLSQDPDRYWMSVAFEEMLTTDLAFSDDLWVVPTATVAKVRQQLTLDNPLSPEAQRHLFATLGVDYGLTGSVAIVPGSDPEQIRLDLQLTFREPATVAATVTETGDPRALEELSLLAGTRLRGWLTAREGLSTELWSAGLEKTSAPAPVYYRGLAALRQSDPRLASELLTQALSGAPVNPWGYYALAHALSAVGRDTEALTAASQALELASELPTADRLRIEADLHALAGHWDAALARYRELRVQEPSNLDNGLALARALLLAGQPEAAEAALTAIRGAVSTEPLDPRVLVLSAEVSTALGRHRQALAAASHALEVAKTRSAPRVAATARVVQARALKQLGHLERAQATVAAAARDFATAGDRGKALEAKILLASFLEEQGQMAEAERLETAVLADAREIGSVRLETAVLPRLAQHYWDGGDQSRAEVLFQRSIALRREVGDRRGEASVLTEYAAKSAIYGERDRVAAHFRQALAIYRELGDRKQVSAALVRIGRESLLEGEVNAAIPALEEATEIQRQLGNPDALANTLLNLGYARCYTGDVDAAIRILEETVAISRAGGRFSMLAVSLEGLGFARMLAGDMAGAENDYRASLSHLTAPWTRARAQAGLAWVHLAAGDLGEAERTARAAIAMAKESGYLPVQLIAHSQLTEVLFTQGNITEAHREAQSMMATPYPTDYWSLGKLFRGITLARITGATGDPRRARELLEATVRVASENGAETVVLEANLARCEIAQYTPSDRTCLDSDLAALEARAASLGLAWLERRARELTPDA